MNPLFRAIAFALLIASPTAFAGSDDDSFRTKGDPARWDRPLETPREKYDNAMLEARNALAEALRDCRQSRDERASCEAAARREHDREVSQARASLAPQRERR